MAIKKRTLIRTLETKLGFVFIGGAKHDAYTCVVSGKRIATARVSRGHKEISDSILRQIAKQLWITLAELKRLIDCSMTLDEYLERLRQQGKLT